MKKVAIVQSNYIPWKGYLDLIASVDEFIIYDDMQYTRRDWRNRNRIKTPQGAQWLTVPVKVKGKFLQSIRDTEIEDSSWAEAHWRSLTLNYRRAPYFEEVAEIVEPLYRNCGDLALSQLNRKFLEAICRYLSIQTSITNSWDYDLLEGKTERLAALCEQAGGTEYVSGPSAKNYLDPVVFKETGIELTWFEYGVYPTYPQLWGDFIHEVTILDLLFNCGKDARDFMKYTK